MEHDVVELDLTSHQELCLRLLVEISSEVEDVKKRMVQMKWLVTLCLFSLVFMAISK